MRKAQGKPADIWGVGCVVLEMLTGVAPWSNSVKNLDDFARQISSGTPPPFPSEISENCRDFLFKTLKFKPEDRPSPLDLLEHPFVREDLHDTSYMEAESIQTVQTFQSHTPGRVLDLLGSDAKAGERKYMDLKTNNFMRKQSGNISMSHIHVDRYGTGMTGDFSTFQAGVGQRADSKELKYPTTKVTSFEKDAEVMSTSSKAKKPKLVRVSEANLEDELSPGTNMRKDFEYKFGTKEKSAEDEMREKEARRRQLEEEMNRDLMRMNTGNLNEDVLREITEEEAGSQSLHSSHKKSQQNRKAHVPITNSLFANEGVINEQKDNYKGYESKYQTQFREKMIVDTGNNLMASSIDDKRAKDNMQSKSIKHSEADLTRQRLETELANSGIQMTTSSIKKPNNREGQADPNNEEEIQKEKEKLRRQFEEQMELSLARVNSERLNHIWEREGHSEEPSEIGENRQTEKNRGNFEEDLSAQFAGSSADNFKDSWKMDDLGRFSTKKFEDVLGNLRGGWESHGEEGEDSIKGSPQMTESEGKSPEDRLKKKTIDIVKFTGQPRNEGSYEKNKEVEGMEDNREVQIENIKARDIDVTDEEENEKLGVINEAEEMKEDSFEDEAFFNKPSSKQNI